MQLKDLLWKYRHRQIDLVRAARAEGSTLDSTFLSRIMSGTLGISERRHGELIAGLVALGIPKREIAQIAELKPRRGKGAAV